VARKRTGRHRGRPRVAHAKRHTTTREGRRTGQDPIDGGSPWLMRRKVRVANGRTDLPLDGGAVLFAHDLIDREQFDRLGEVTRWLQATARAWGGRDGSVSGLWSSIIAAATRMGSAVAAVPAGADAARFRLVRALSRLDGSRDLVVELAEGRVPPVVVHVLEGTLTAGDYAQLARLRVGLDRM
jgi:hypothetical protein